MAGRYLKLLGCAVAVVLLTASKCVTTSERSSAPASAKMEASASDRAKTCEIKTTDGHDACAEDHRHAPREFKTGPAGVAQVWTSILTGDFPDYMADAKAAREAEASADAEPSPDEATGEGCVWKGRAYSQGQSIYYTQGPIYSRDLLINGQSFEALSGEPGPWQQCQCSSSSGHWGCV